MSEDASDEALVWAGAEYEPGPPTPFSGWNWIVIRPDRLDWDVVVASSRKWLSRNYGDLVVEWAYRDVPPRILVEELLRGPGGKMPLDYKFFVFDGRVRFAFVVSGRFHDPRVDMFLPDWTPVDVRYGYPRADGEIPRPPSLERMVELAKALGRGIDFVRVDLYGLEERGVFGELTNYPDNGFLDFEPTPFDAELGGWWALPSTNR